MKNAYTETINNYVTTIKEELSNELLLILIIESSSSNKVIKGWSDIDVILVVENYNFNIVNKVKEINNKGHVKIGTTIYSRDEFINKKIDQKTYYHLYLLQNNQITPQYKKENFSIPQVTFEEIVATHNPYLNWRLNIYKRNFLYNIFDKSKVKGIFKTTYLIMKAKLIIDGYMPKNYDEVFNLYSKNYNIKYFEY